MNREEYLDILINMANCWVMESSEIEEDDKIADEVVAYFKELIERDKPRGVIFHDDIHDYGECTTCEMLVNADYIFCPECGQRLDWREE